MKRILLGLLALSAIVVILKWGRVEKLNVFDAWMRDFLKHTADGYSARNKSMRTGSRF